MATFPISRTTRTPSGRGGGVAAPMQVDRSGEIIGSALMELGGVGFDEAAQWNKLHAYTEQSKAQYMAQERLVALANATDEQTDAATYKTMYESAVKDIESYRPTSKMGGRLYDFWLNANKPHWAMATSNAIKTRLARTQAEDMQRRQADYAGRIEGFITDTIMAGGVQAGFEVARDEETIAEAAKNGIMADDLMRIARTARQNVLDIKADEEFALAQRQKNEAAMVDANDRNITAMTLATLRGAARPGEEITPSMIEKAMRSEDPATRISEVTGRMMHGLLMNPKKTEPSEEKRRTAYKIVSDAMDEYHDGKLSESEAGKVWIGQAPLLSESQNVAFIKQINEIGDAVVTNWKSVAKKNATEILGGDRSLGMGMGLPAAERIAAEGLVAERIDQLLDREFPSDKPFDENKFMAKSLDIILQVKEEKQPSMLLPTSAVPSGVITPPPGFEGLWKDMSTDQRKKVAGYSAAQKKAFLDAYQAKPVPEGPLAVNPNEIPSSAFAR